MDKNKLVKIIANVWPTIKKMLDEIFYFILNLIKSIVKISVRQTTGK